MHRMVQDRYTSNVFGVFNVIRHVGCQFFMETMMRAAQGEPRSRPTGSPYHFSPWKQLLLIRSQNAFRAKIVGACSR